MSEIKNLSLRVNRCHRHSKRGNKKYRPLSEPIIDAIVEAYVAGELVASIAERLGISHSAVSDAARRRGVPLRNDHRRGAGGFVRIHYDQDERERRMHGNAARDVTGSLMGDPPIGFSALDRRTR